MHGNKSVLSAKCSGRTLHSVHSAVRCFGSPVHSVHNAFSVIEGSALSALSAREGGGRPLSEKCECRCEHVVCTHRGEPQASRARFLISYSRNVLYCTVCQLTDPYRKGNFTEDAKSWIPLGRYNRLTVTYMTCKCDRYMTVTAFV